MRLPLLFLIVMLPFGLVLARLVPIGSVPDETAHAVRAYSVSTGQWIGRRQPLTPGQTIPITGFEVDDAFFAMAFFSTRPDELEDAATDAGRRQAGWSYHMVFSNVPNTATYAPVFYLPSGAAIGLARLVGLGPYDAIEFGRLVNLACYALIGACALVIAGRMRWTMLAVLCLPMSVALAASLNQDGLVIAFAVLAAALLTRPGPVARRWAAVALAAVCLAKPPYCPLVALLLVPPSLEALPHPRRRIAWGPIGWGFALAVLAALPAVLWTAAALRWAATPFGTPPYTPGPLYEGTATTLSATDSAAQMAIIAKDALRLVTLPLASLRPFGMNWVHEMVGVLGNLNLVLPEWLYKAWYGAALCAVLADMLSARPTARRWGPVRAVLTVAVVLLTILSISLAQYLTWTHVGAAMVEGLQGRYFLPLLPLLALAVPVWPGIRPWTAVAVLRLPVPVVCVAQFIAVPILVVRRWYLH